MNKVLYFFTVAYPFGRDVQWKTEELSCYLKYFKQIHVVPFHYGSGSNPAQTPKGIEIHLPLIKSRGFAFYQFFTNFSSWGPFINDFFNRRVYTNPRRFLSWARAVVIAQALRNHPMIKQLEEKDASDVVLYFYWGIGSCYIAPFLKNNYAKIVTKFHAGDLYEYRNDGYLPIRKDLFSSISSAIFISDNGYSYAATNYPIISSKSRVCRLGVVSYGISMPSQDGILRIFTCAFISAVKRMTLIIEALKLVESSVEWTHIGDGPDFEKIKLQAATLPQNIKVRFVGRVQSEKVSSYYIGQYADVFLNVSSSEGIPVSIMEALAAGIPVFATDVGGTSEIVDNSVGKLFPVDVSASTIAKELKEFSNKSINEIAITRNRAFQRFKDRCDADKNFQKLAEYLSE